MCIRDSCIGSKHLSTIRAFHSIDCLDLSCPFFKVFTAAGNTFSDGHIFYSAVWIPAFFHIRHLSNFLFRYRLQTVGKLCKIFREDIKFFSNPQTSALSKLQQLGKIGYDRCLCICLLYTSLLFLPFLSLSSFSSSG